MTFQVYESKGMKYAYFMGFSISEEELEDMANSMGYRLVKKEDKR